MSLECMFHTYRAIKENNVIKMKNRHFDYILNTFTFYLFDPNKISKCNELLARDIGQEFYIVDEYSNNNEMFYIMCFDCLLFIVKQEDLDQFNSHLSKKQFNKVIFITNDITKSINTFVNNRCPKNLKFSTKIKNESFRSSILNFSNEFSIQIPSNLSQNIQNSIYEFWKIIKKSISGYLIEKATKKLKINRYLKSNEFFNAIEMGSDDFIDICRLKKGSSSYIDLIYSITKEQLFVFKLLFDLEDEELLEREQNNYKQIRHPFIPHYLGTTDINFKKGIIIEYIKGQTLYNIKSMNLSFEQKIKIVFEILILFKYLHRNNFVYRDLKPDNIIINKEYKTISLVDFGRMIEYNSESFNKMTIDFQHDFVAPEILLGHSYSFESDIYSIGMVINYIFAGDESVDNEYMEDIKKIINECIQEDFIKRKNIVELTYVFTLDFYNILFAEYSKIRSGKEFFTSITDDIVKIHINFHLGIKYAANLDEKKNIEKAIFHYTKAANQGHHGSEYLLGEIYSKDFYNYKCKDTEKAIYYLSRACKDENCSDSYAILGDLYIEKNEVQKGIEYLKIGSNLNNIESQVKLGNIYYDNKYVPKDINKAIYYYKLAADQNNVFAQHDLAIIYLSDIKDIDKGIYYLTLAADLNHVESQCLLARIYINGKFVTRNINKVLHYLSLSSNQNHNESQFFLGELYYDGILVEKDIKKGIYWLKLSAQNGYLMAQFFLGKIYEKYNIDESIHYYTLAANQNYVKAQYILGCIYNDNVYVPKDIHKSIYYFKLAAENKDSDAQYMLGTIYLFNDDADKGIHYLLLAANQKHSYAQMYLFFIYFNGININQNINKSIHYLLESAFNYNSISQYFLGCLYLSGYILNKDIKKGIFWLTNSADNGYYEAQRKLGDYYYKSDINKSIHYFKLSAEKNDLISQRNLGFIYSENKYIERDIQKAVYYFKKASSFNDQYLKNNLAILYKNGFNVEQNIAYAIELLEEAIGKKGDEISMFNLSHIYLFNEIGFKNIDKSIDLSIQLLRKNNFLSVSLLSIALIEKLGVISLDSVKNEIKKYDDEKFVEWSNYVFDYIVTYEIDIPEKFQLFYQSVKEIEFIYKKNLQKTLSTDWFSQELKNHPNIQMKKIKQNNINNDFYIGFGILI